MRIRRESFLRVYAEMQLPRKYSGLVRRAKDETDEDEQVYSTSDGDVLLTRSGRSVYISEGFPLALALEAACTDRIASDSVRMGRCSWLKLLEILPASGVGQMADPGLSTGAADVVGWGDEGGARQLGCDGRMALRDDILLISNSK